MTPPRGPQNHILPAAPSLSLC
ncbi:rCG36717 [Rattus norvegicus]|uniref:RCG36717 n=1 Tax=Rattus norvegicus TaxID=10116 RepID=A6JSP0_RAT|nr:rCG36717 [Rattus norvegicus]